MMAQESTSDYVSAVTPEPSSPTDSHFESSPTPEGEDSESHKRKRKSWGQAIPEYEKILPPGKRAKTDAEKEQRRCERIMRNRRAAATSRDRKKKEFEEMEKKVEAKDAELAWVRQQAQEQMQRILSLAFPDGNIPPALANIEMSIAAPPYIPQRQSSLPPTPAYSPIEASQSPQMKRQASPALSIEEMPVNNTPTATVDPSPTLAPSLFVNVKKEETEVDQLYSQPPSQGFPDLSNHHNDNLENIVANAIVNPNPVLDTFANFEGSAMTQYPAEVLCEDQQCHPEPSKAVSRTTSMSWVNSILVIQLMVASAISSISSVRMISLVCKVLGSLERIWPQALASPEMMDMMLPLIHSLIILPLKTTSRRAFRTSILRKLLSCSPHSARLFDAAVMRALSRLNSADVIQESQRGVITFSSLMTIRWVVWNIKREDHVHRERVTLSTKSDLANIGDRSLGTSMFEGASLGRVQRPGERACTPGPHVH